MPLDTELIERLLKQKGVTKSEISLQIGMTREGFSRSLVTNKLHADKIESLANLLKVNVCDLFGVKDEFIPPKNERNVCVMCSLKDEIIQGKERESEALRKIIALLEHQYSTRIE